MKKKNRYSHKKIMRVVGCIVIIGLILIGSMMILKPKKQRQSIPDVKVEDQLDDYDYVLNENETDYYKSLFKELKEILSKDEIDEEAYASCVAKLFLTDFFHLSNKTSKNDIGGTQFVYHSYQNDFEQLAKESVYHMLKNNIYGDRKQKLPEVEKVEVIGIETEEYQYLDQIDEHAYVVQLKVIYKEDLGYQTNTTLVLAHVDHKLEIIKMIEG